MKVEKTMFAYIKMYVIVARIKRAYIYYIFCVHHEMYALYENGRGNGRWGKTTISSAKIVHIVIKWPRLFRIFSFFLSLLLILHTSVSHFPVCHSTLAAASLLLANIFVVCALHMCSIISLPSMAELRSHFTTYLNTFYL